jgi:hypothetical protein
MAGLKLKYPPERMFKWVKFWDEQMYKSLEAGYQMGLESLNESLADIKVSTRLCTCNSTLWQLTSSQLVNRTWSTSCK